MRLINADALIKTIDSHCYPVQHDMTSIEPGMTRIGILQAIQEQPTIEPERKTGKWIEYDNSHCECPFCHTEWSYFDNEVEHFDFCPRCGAKMEGEKDG